MWAFFATAGTRVITLASLAILARLLAPKDFGLLAFALVYITYAETIGDLGTTVALVYWPDRREDASQVTFLINMVTGIAWFLATLALAPLIAEFFRNPEATSIVRTLAFAFLFKFAGNTHDALAQKDLRFRARTIPELSLAFLKAALSIAFAAAGLGAWSLVWGHLAGLAVWTCALWLIVPWRPSTHVPRDLFGPMLRYGRGIVGVNIVAAITHHADLAIVGRMLGSTALGLYQLAYKIPEASITVIIWVVGKVLFPTFAALQGNVEQLRAAYLKALSYVALITIPIAAGLFVTADPLVRVFFGEKWVAAAPLLRWLAMYAGIRSIGTHAGDVMKATGRSGLLFGFGVVKAVILVPALILAARWSVESVAMTLAFVTAFTVAMNIAIVMRLLHFGMADLLAALKVSLLAGTALFLVCLPLQRLSGSFVPQLQVVLLAVAGSIAYGLTLHLLDRSLIRELMTPLRKRRPEEPA